MILNSARIPLKDNYGRFKVILNEPDCSDSTIEISGLPQDALVIKADSWPAPDQVFAGSKGECKRADYVIISEKNNKTVVICIEMKKSNNSTSKKIIEQLTGAKCFILYCQSIGRGFWSERDFLGDAVYRFVGFCHTSSIRKRPTRVTRTSSIHDQPDQFLKIDWPNHVEFNRLTGQV